MNVGMGDKIKHLSGIRPTVIDIERVQALRCGKRIVRVALQPNDLYFTTRLTRYRYCGAEG